MICKIKHYTISIDYDGYLWPREYNFNTFKCIIAFIEGIKTQYFMNCPDQYLQEYSYKVPKMYSEYVNNGGINGHTAIEYESYLYGIGEARGIYGFNLRIKGRNGW